MCLLELNDDNKRPPANISFFQERQDLVEGIYECLLSKETILIKSDAIFKFSVKDRYVDRFLEPLSEWSVCGVDISSNITKFSYDITREPLNNNALKIKRIDTYTTFHEGKNEYIDHKFLIIDVTTAKKLKELKK